MSQLKRSAIGFNEHVLVQRRKKISLHKLEIHKLHQSFEEYFANILAQKVLKMSNQNEAMVV